MNKPRTSDIIPEVLAMPERNRAERRRKRHACRGIVRSRYFRKHGSLGACAPALRDAATRTTYTKRLRAWMFVFTQRENRVHKIDDIREGARLCILDRGPT